MIVFDRVTKFFPTRNGRKYILRNVSQPLLQMTEAAAQPTHSSLVDLAYMTMANVGGHNIVGLLNILTDVGGVITSGHASHQLIARVLSVFDHSVVDHFELDGADT